MRGVLLARELSALGRKGLGEALASAEPGKDGAVPYYLKVIVVAVVLTAAAVSQAQVGAGDQAASLDLDAIGEKMHALGREDRRRWPDLDRAVWALVDPQLPTHDRLGVESRVRGALMGPQPQGEVVGALSRTLTASATFFDTREDCADEAECALYRRIAHAFRELGKDLHVTWYHSGAADMIVSLTRMAAEDRKAGIGDGTRWDKQRAHAVAQRARGLDGPASLRQRAAVLRAEGESQRAWRVETLAKAIGYHPEPSLPK